MFFCPRCLTDAHNLLWSTKALKPAWTPQGKSSSQDKCIKQWSWCLMFTFRRWALWGSWKIRSWLKSTKILYTSFKQWLAWCKWKNLLNVFHFLRVLPTRSVEWGHNNTWYSLIMKQRLISNGFDDVIARKSEVKSVDKTLLPSFPWLVSWWGSCILQLN